VPEAALPHGQLLERLERALTLPDLQLANSLCLELRCALTELDRDECLVLLERVRALRERATVLRGALERDLKHRGVRRSAASAYRAVPLDAA
jgi:hypothetical protein